MTLFAYNEKSFLNKEFIRIINRIILFLLLALQVVFATCTTNTIYINVPMWLILFFVAFNPTVIYTAVRTTLQKTIFFEWDYTERKKKQRFTTAYVLMTTFICSSINMSAMMLYGAIQIRVKFLIILYAIALIFFVFNIFNIVSLYYSLFEDDIKMPYEIQQKPDNWQENG